MRYNRKGSSRYCNQILSKLKDKIVFRFNNLLIDEGPLTKVIQSSDATTRKHEQCKYVGQVTIDRIRESNKRVTGCKSLKTMTKISLGFLSFIFRLKISLPTGHALVTRCWHNIHDRILNAMQPKL